VISFQVLGKPATKGSWKIRRGKGKAWLTADNDKERPWADAVAWRGKEAMRGRPLIDEGVEVAILIEVSRPKDPVREFPVGDVDKMARSVLDALTGIVWRDDVLVTSLSVTKRYTEREQGAWIQIVTESEVAARAGEIGG
jgi:crossover junction endodeoxyribonuclease RusA